MNNFLTPDPEAGGFLTDELESAPTATPKGQLSTKERMEDLKFTTGLTEGELQGLTDANAVAFEPISSLPLPPVDTEGVLQAMVSKGATLEELEAGVQKKMEIEKALTDVSNMTSVDYALANDPTASGVIFRYENRAGTARKELLDMAEASEDGWAGKIAEFIGIMAYDTYLGFKNVYGDLVLGDGSEISEISDKWEVAMRTYDDVEFEKFKAERMADLTGSILSGPENSWRILREVEAMEAAGAVLWDEEMGRLFGLMSAADIATLGAFGATKAVSLGSKGVKTISTVGKSVVGKIRRTQGTTVSTKAATGNSLVIREKGLTGVVEEGAIAAPKKNRIKDDILDAEFIDDVVPSSVRTRVGAEAAGEAPSVGAISQAVAGNKFVQQFLYRQGRFSFGTADPLKSGKEWAFEQAAIMSKASGTHVLDYDVVEEGVQQVKATFTLGKDIAMPFKTKSSAEKMAQNYPNSRVVPSQGTEGLEWKIEVDARVPLKETVEATDLSKVKLKTKLWQLIGRADRGTDSFMSNLADASDFGDQAFKQDFKQVTKDLNSLPKGVRKTIDDILTTLRDTPNGGTARTWLTDEDFVKAYKYKTGELPSQETVKAYEDLVEMSDFSWWVKANERLTTLANQKTSMVQVGETFVKANPTRNKPSGFKQSREAVWVYDANLGKRVSGKILDDDAPLLELSAPLADGSTFVTNYYGKTRIPDLEDAFPYNAGGPRSNPDIEWFIGNNEGNWSTLIGARSQEEANKTVAQFNAIADAVAREVGGDLKNVGAMSSGTKQRLNDLIKNNNDWNPNIENIDDFIKFTKERGVPANQRVARRGRNERIANVLKTSDQSLVDLKLEAYVSFHRHDLALKEFGGMDAANIDPILAIHSQYNQMVTRGAQMQYRMAHPSAWVKAYEKHMGDINAPSGGRPMTDEMRVRSIEVVGETTEAKKLRQEQSVINRRLDMFEGSESALPTEDFSAGVSKATEWAAQVAHGYDNGVGSTAYKILKGSKRHGGNLLLSAGFFQKMGSIDQLLLQPMHALPMMSISPANGGKGFQVAAVIRQAARSADDSTWRVLYENLKYTTGLDEAEMKALMEHMLDSGRGYMRGAIAEDPTAGVGTSAWGKAKDILSTPYYMGENFSATMSRATAFLDTRKKFPDYDINSRQFWNEVQKRDRDLSFALNKAQKSEIQTDTIAKIGTQWTSYPLRTLENVIFGGETLSLRERGLLTAYTTLFWGLSGLGFAKTAQSVKENETFGWFLSNVIADGADFLFNEKLGIKVGSRVGFNVVELFERAAQTVTLQAGEAVPAVAIVEGVTKPLLSALMNLGSGRTELAKYDLATLLRVYKVVDGPIMAYQMHMDDIRRSRTGTSIKAEFTPTQEFLQAIGITPAQATEYYNASKISFSRKERRKKALDAAVPSVRIAIEFAEKGEKEKARQFMLDASAIIDSYGFTGVRKAEIREALFNKVGQDKVSWFGLEMVKDHYIEEAQRFKEMFSE